MRFTLASLSFEQRQRVQVNDILLLQNALWETIDQAEVDRQVVLDNAQDKVTSAIERFLAESTDIIKGVQSNSSEAALEAVQKLKTIQQENSKLQRENPARMEIGEAL